MKNYYEILEVNEKASDEIIKKVYKIKIKQNHPDLFQGDEKIKAEEITKNLTEVYDILSNPQKREEYDLELENQKKENTNDFKYENIINNLKNENEYLKQIIISKNNTITTFINNDLPDSYHQQISNNNYQNHDNIKDEKKAYFTSVLYDLKQLGFKFIAFFSVLILLLILFWLFTGNNIFKIIKETLFI